MQRSGLSHLFKTAIFLIAAFAGACCGSRAAEAGQGATKRPLRILSWDLDAGDKAIPTQAEKTEPNRWRHTFGTERREKTKAQMSNLAEELNADVVLLQGVRSVGKTKRIFPARRWALIISRQILGVYSNAEGGRSRVPANFATTAIAVRYKSGVRITAREHLLQLATETERPGEQRDDNTQGGKTNKIPKPAKAGVAARLRYEGKTIWVVSTAFPARCPLNGKSRSCMKRKQLRNWAQNKRTAGVPVVLGGKNVALIPDKAQPKSGPRHVQFDHCEAQGFVANLKVAALQAIDIKTRCLGLIEVLP